MASANTAIRLVPITTGSSVLDPLPRGFRAEGTGSVTYVNQGSDSTSRTVNVVGVEYFPFSPLKITGTTGGVVVAGYYGGEG